MFSSFFCQHLYALERFFKIGLKFSGCGLFDNLHISEMSSFDDSFYNGRGAKFFFEFRSTYKFLVAHTYKNFAVCTHKRFGLICPCQLFGHAARGHQCIFLPFIMGQKNCCLMPSLVNAVLVPAYAQMSLKAINDRHSNTTLKHSDIVFIKKFTFAKSKTARKWKSKLRPF